MSSGHSSTTAAGLVKSNQELRCRVQQLEDKLVRAEATIAKAVELATNGKNDPQTVSENNGLLSVSTTPSSLLALAESIASSTLPVSRGGGSRTPPPSGTSEERIESLVVSNRELRYALTDSKSNVEQQGKQVQSLQRIVESHEAKILSLISELDASRHRADQIEQEYKAATAVPSQWEIERIRLKEMQDKEREQMIELLNRERATAQEERESFNEQLATTLEAEVSNAAKLLEASHELIVISLKEEIQQQQIVLDLFKARFKECSLKLQTAQDELGARREVSLHTVRLGEGASSVERLLNLPSAAQRQPMTDGKGYCYFPLELHTEDYMFRLLRVVDRAVRSSIARCLLGSALEKEAVLESPSSDDSLSSGLLSISSSGTDTTGTKNSIHDEKGATGGVNTPSAMLSNENEVPIQDILAPPLSTVLAETSPLRPPTLSLQTFLSLHPNDSRISNQSNKQALYNSSKKCTRIGIQEKRTTNNIRRLPLSIVDVLELYIDNCIGNKPTIALGSHVASLRDAAMSPEVRPALQLFESIKAIFDHFLVGDLQSLKGEDGEDESFVSHLRQQITALEHIQKQEDAHHKLRSVRMTVLGWRYEDIRSQDSSCPPLVPTIGIMLDNIRFVGVSSDVRQLERLSRSLQELNALFTQSWCKTSDAKQIQLRPLQCLVQYYARIHLWKVFLESLPITTNEEHQNNTSAYSILLKNVCELLQSPISLAYSGLGIPPAIANAIKALLSHWESNELAIMAAKSGEIDATPTCYHITGNNFLKYLCAAACAAKVCSDTANILAKEAYSEDEFSAAQEARKVEQCMQELIHTLSPLLEHAQLFYQVTSPSKKSLLASDDISAVLPMWFGGGCIETMHPAESGGMMVSWPTSHDLERLHVLSKTLIPQSLLVKMNLHWDPFVLSKVITVELLWEVPFYSLSKSSATNDGFSLCSLALMCNSPSVLLQAYSLLDGLTAKVPVATYNQLIRDITLLEQAKMALLIGPSDENCTCMNLPVSWITKFMKTQLLSSPVSAATLRRTLGISIFTMFNSRLYSRLEILKACAFNKDEIRKQHVYHEKVSIAKVSAEYNPEILEEGCTVRSTDGSRYDFFSEDHHHLAPFSAWELRAAGIKAEDARYILGATPLELQVGGYNDYDVIVHAGFSWEELGSSGAARICMYKNVERAVLCELYRCTSDGAAVGAASSSNPDRRIDGWRRDYNWLSSCPLNEWYGVSTNAHKQVIKIDLRCNRLKGNLPPCLRLLHSLETLNVHDNQLTGQFPIWFSELRSLRVLSLHTNYFDQTKESFDALQVCVKSLPNCKVRA